MTEGWQLMRKEWLDPSLERGCWHPEPFTSLREFLAGAEAAGILDGALPVRPDARPIVELVEVHEEAVADVLLGERRADDLRVIDWSATTRPRSPCRRGGRSSTRRSTSAVS